MNRNIIIILLIIVVVIMLYFNRGKIMNIQRKITMDNPVKLPNGTDSNFEWWELTQTSKPYPNIPNATEQKSLEILVAKILQPIRNMFGPTELSSVFRSKKVNEAVGGSDESQHLTGFAADIIRTGNIPLENAFKLIYSSNVPYDQLIYEIGTKNNPDAKWIHISYNPRGGRKQALIAPYNYETKQRDYKLFT